MSTFNYKDVEYTIEVEHRSGGTAGGQHVGIALPVAIGEIPDASIKIECGFFRQQYANKELVKSIIESTIDKLKG